MDCCVCGLPKFLVTIRSDDFKLFEGSVALSGLLADGVKRYLEVV